MNVTEGVGVQCQTYNSLVVPLESRHEQEDDLNMK